MNDFQDLYEVRKTVRFELKPIKNVDLKIEQGNIEELKNQFQNIEQSFLDIFVYRKDFEQNSQIVFQKKRKIKYNWLRTYTGNDFYNFSQNLLNSKNEELRKKGKKELTIKSIDKKPYLASIDYLVDEFLRWITEWESLIQKLKEVTETKEHEQKRRSEIAFVLKGFLKRKNFEFIKEFANAVMDLQNTKGIEEDKQIQELRKLLSETYKNLKACEKEYLPAQSGGLLLHKASLNYYTLNKDKKEYEMLKKGKEEDLMKKIKDWARRDGKAEFWFDRKFQFGENPLYWSLDEAYQKIKIWKAEQKSKFNEAVAGDKLSVLNFRTEFPLFDTTDENFEEFYTLTKELDDLEGEKAKEVAQERGKFFNSPKNKDRQNNQIIQTKNYYELCELYKRIAIKRGEIIAEIKGIENEEIQSQLLDHWAVIFEEGQKKYVVMIPRGAEENHKNAHKYIEDNFDKKKTDGEITLYHFKSLTLRALEKLCFKGAKNTFAPELKKENDPKIWFPKYKEEGRAENKEKYDQKMIEFYKQVLQSKYATKYLDLVDFGGLKDFLQKEDFADLEKFESELEKVCYVKVPLKISLKEKQEFINEFNATEFEMTTRSIAGNKKENRHAEIWKDFWVEKNQEKNYEIRLNPELSIFYRDALNESEGNRNRFSKPRFTLAITITLGATNKKSNLQFKETQEIKNHITSFNEDWEKENQEALSQKWYFGIDRGLKELATLNVVKFSDKKNSFGVSEPQDFAKIAVYKLKDENAFLKDEKGNVKINFKGEKRKVMDNISEVLEEGVEPDGNLFEKCIVSSIDLTQAKLIKKHIILNGDKKTYLKLKELSAKRRIFELFSTSKIDEDSEIKAEKGKTTLKIVCKDGDRDFYWLTKDQIIDSQAKKDIQTKQLESLKDLKDFFTDHLKKIDLKNEDLDKRSKIEQINHLRDAITANMVGILFHLQKTLGMKGFIGLENLDTVREQSNKKMIEQHFDQSNEDISRRLEWSLYRKFANIGAVPPQIKESILLRDDFETYQIGILKFVKVGGTSSNCPNCEKESGKTNGHFVCKFNNSCNFSSKENRNILEQNLHNSDEVAAYNVAKNAFDDVF